VISRLDGGGKLDASKPPSDPADKRDGSTAKPDARVDPGKDATVDAGRDVPDASKPASDAGAACNDKTPHGCFTPAPGNDKGCPAQSPEIPLLLPGLDQWDLCNGAAVGAGTSCTWNGPNGATASCICDTGVHWICVYL
jgi:hypothetical protein